MKAVNYAPRVADATFTKICQSKISVTTQGEQPVVPAWPARHWRWCNFFLFAFRSLIRRHLWFNYKRKFLGPCIRKSARFAHHTFLEETWMENIPYMAICRTKQKVHYKCRKSFMKKRTDKWHHKTVIKSSGQTKWRHEGTAWYYSSQMGVRSYGELITLTDQFVQQITCRKNEQNRLAE